MNVAYISYEFPFETLGGGIGTYIYQIGLLMSKYGHDVEIFCGTYSMDDSFTQDGIQIHGVYCENREEFKEKVLPIFSKRHQAKAFDIIEGPDYGADAFEIKKLFPTLPYIVKLHSPTFLVSYYNNYRIHYSSKKTLRSAAKYYLKAFLGINKYYNYEKNKDVEYINALSANLLVSPSTQLLKLLQQYWELNSSQCKIVSNPYLASKDLLSIPLSYNHNRVTFIGKLSVLKGVVDFIKAIPKVLDMHPDIQFRFIGADSFSPINSSMKEYMSEQLGEYMNNIEITGLVNPVRIANYLAETDIVVCCSLWENYPTVILEAMSAGRIIIATRVGGIIEMIDHKKTGILISPYNSSQLSKAINWVYGNRENASKLGYNSRYTMQKEGNLKKIYQQTLQSYKLAIKRCNFH